MKLKYVLAITLLLSSHGWGEVQKSQLPDDSDSPNILYVVPWMEIKRQKVKDPKLVIHNLLGDLYEPQLPDEFLEAP